MSDKNLDVGITIKTTGGKQSANEIDKITASTKSAGAASKEASREFAAMAKTLKKMFAGITIATITKDILDTNRAMESLRAQLKALSGSAAEAQRTFQFISKFAKDTPYEISGLTKTFIMLQNFGINPTAKTMEAITNQASKLGASQETLTGITLALGQAYSKGRLQAEEMNQLTERGVPIMKLLAEVTGKSGAALQDMAQKGEITRDVIDKLIVKMGELASGSNAAAMDTLNGKISNLSDAWHNFEDTLLNDKSEGILAGIVAGATELLNTLSRNMSSALDEQIAHAQARISTFNSMGSFGKMAGDFLGYDVNVEKNRVDSLNRQKQKEDEAHRLVEITKNSNAAIAQTNTWLDELEETQNKKKVSRHGSVSRSHSSHVSNVISAAQREREELQRNYDSEMKSLQDKNAQLSQTPREYEKTRLAARKLTDEMIEQALRIYDVNVAWEAKKKTEEDSKNAMETLIDRYNQLTLSAREYYKTKLEGEGIKGAAQAPVLAQFDKNTAAEAQKKALDESRQAMQDYVNEVDNAKSSMDALAASSNDVFNASIGGTNQLVGALEAMVKGLHKNTVEFEELAKKKKLFENVKLDKTSSTYMQDLKLQNDARKKYEVDYQNLQNDTINQYIGGVQTMAGAAASMFADNEAAQIASQSIMLVTIGIQAALAVLTQGGGDPYTAWARIAAMAGLVAGIVSSVGGSSSGSISIPPNPPNSADTGTVLGDKTAQSESVNNVTDLLKSIHAAEYAELRGINKGVAALSGGILNAVTKTFQTGAITGTEAPHLGMSKYKLVSGGLATGQVNIADLLTGTADIAGQMYTTEQHQTGSKKKPKFSFKDYFTPMESDVVESLKGMFSGIGQTMSEVSGKLGLDIGKDLSEKLNDAIIPALKIDIIGLSGEEAIKKVNAVISTAMDDVATQVFGDIVGQYQQLGEGMLETAIRIVSEVAVVRDALNQSGMTMAGNAIELSDALVQAAGGLEEFQQQFEGFYDKFYTGLEKQNRLQTRLNETFAEVYMLLPRTREEYRKNMESLNLNNSLDRERYSLMLQLSSAADQYYTSIESGNNDIKNSQSARYEQEIQWLRLSGDEIAAVALERKREYEAMEESLVPMQKIIDKYGDLVGELTNSYNTAADLLTSTFTKFFNLAKSLVQFRDALKVGDLSTGSPESKYKENKASFESMRDIIKAGPGKTDASELRYQNALVGLQGASEKFLSSSKDYNASTKNYAKDFNDVMKTLTSGANKSLDIASDAEKQLNKLNEMVSGLAKINLSIINLDGSIGKLDGSIKLVKGSTDKAPSATDALRESINSKNGLKGATDSVKDKVKELNTNGGIKGAMGKVGDAVAGLTAAMIEMNGLQKERDRLAKVARDATKKAEADRLAAQKALDDKMLSNKQSVYGAVVGKSDLNAMTWLAKNNGVDEATAATYGKSWSDWAKAMIGTFDPGKSLDQYQQLSVLTDDFRGYLAAQAKGQPYAHDGSYYAAEFKKINGSHKDGLDYVPFDGYVAKLHQGERVQTANEARDSDRKANEATQKLLQQVLEELQNANKQRGAVAKETLEKTDKVIANAQAQTRAIKRIQIS
ncbi:MAG: tape measure protein [Methylobacter sp.]|uniref:tape measure protein n=1 Tax=Methylobacter sp. TaxID=2051955 RepID=UPI0025E213F2|nr:tape measure protein [Methylobacter sp.]MCK9621989.1 tape measure protein [Methylobacter sp.]